MVHRNTLTSTLIVAAFVASSLFCASISAADKNSSTVDDLSRAANELGLQMLRPHTKVEPHRPYSMIVRDPQKLIPLGVDNVGPGDRVMCRLLDGNRIVLYTSYGDRSAPIQLAADGSVKKVQKVREMEGNKHYSAQQRDRRQQQKQQQQQQQPGGGQTGFGGLSGGRGGIR